LVVAVMEAAFPSSVDKLWKELKEAVSKEAVSKELSIIQAQREAFRKEKEEFEETKKKIASVHFPTNIKLDVGGKIFKTSLTTKERRFYAFKNVLRNWISGRER